MNPLRNRWKSWARFSMHNYIELEPHEWITDRSIQDKLKDTEVSELLYQMVSNAGWQETGGRMFIENDDSVHRTLWLASDPRLMDIIKGTGYSNYTKLKGLVDKAIFDYSSLTENQRVIIENLANECEVRIIN